MMSVNKPAEILIVSWNARNLRTFSLMERPHSTAFASDARLSSRITILEACLATSVPDPIAQPT